MVVGAENADENLLRASAVNRPIAAPDFPRYHCRTDRLFGEMQSAPRPRIETYALVTIRAILAQGEHLTLLTRFEAELEQAAGQLVLLACDPLEFPVAIGVD